MKKRIVVSVVIVLFLSGCISASTPSPIPNSVSTQISISTVAPTLTPVLTSTSTITPTPIPFPPTFKDFGKEIIGNCAPPPKFKLKYSSESSFQDMPKSIILENMQLEMSEWLKDKSEKEEWDYWSIKIYWDENIWYCVGVVLAPSIIDIISQPDMWFGSGVILIPSKENSWENPFKDWGEWNVPVTLAYWSENGLVTYKYEPTTMPAP